MSICSRVTLFSTLIVACTAIRSKALGANQEDALPPLGAHTHHSDPWHLTQHIRESYWVPEPASLLQIVGNANVAREEKVMIHYNNGFFGSMLAEDFECDIPCSRSVSPGRDGYDDADVFMSFSINPTPPTNDRGALAFAHTMEAPSGYGGENIGKYSYEASTRLQSTVPWLYFDWKSFAKLREKRQAGEIPGFDARLPRVAFVARNCGGNQRNELIKALSERGVPIDAISDCVPHGSVDASWPEGIPRTNKLGALEKYRMYLAVENTIEQGYVTEKVMDGYAAGALNIYLGAPDIKDYLPDNTYLFANNAKGKANLDELANHILKALSDKGTWESYFTPMDENMENWSGGRYKETMGFSRDPVNNQCHLCQVAMAHRLGKKFNRQLMRIEG